MSRRGWLRTTPLFTDDGAVEGVRIEGDRAAGHGVQRAYLLLSLEEAKRLASAIRGVLSRPVSRGNGRKRGRK